LRELLEVEILRGNHPAPAEDEMRWKLARSWVAGNLAIHAPVPALCDYLRMSPSTLHRFFRAQTGFSPGGVFLPGEGGGGAAVDPRGGLAGQGGGLSSRLSAC
jgi:AraC-like DNA-binding protein